MVKFIKTNWVLVIALLLLIILSIPLLYFGNLLKMMSSPNNAIFDSSQTQQLDIGVCFNSLMEARWMKEWAVMEDAAGSQQLSIGLKVAHHSLLRQISQINDLLARNIKVLILNPVSQKGLEGVLEEARSKGVKIIFYDEMTDGPCDLFLGVDYRDMGRIQAKTLLEKAGPGNYLVFKGPGNSYRSEILYNGQQEILKMKSEVGADILSVNALNHWSADEAVTKIRATIAHQKLQGILIPEDLIAESVVNFYREQKSALAFITGAGAELAACQRILRREQLMTVAWNLPELAKTAIMSANRFIQKKKIMGSMMTFGNRRLPAYLCPVYLVDSTNLQTVLVNKLKLYTTADLATMGNK